MLTETEIRLVGALGFLFILYSALMGQMKAQDLPGGYRNPVLALELVKNGADIDVLNRSAGGKASEFVRKHLRKDFGYIAIYVAFFCCLGLILAKLSSHWGKGLGLVAAVCALIAGLLDLIENRGMLKALSTSDATDSLADSIRYPSLAKWAFLFLFSLMVGLILSWRQGWLLIPGLTFVLAALLGLSGVASNLMRPKFYWMFPASLFCLGLGIVWTAIAFTFWPAKVLNKFLNGS